MRTTVFSTPPGSGIVGLLVGVICVVGAACATVGVSVAVGTRVAVGVGIVGVGVG